MSKNSPLSKTHQLLLALLLLWLIGWIFFSWAAVQDDAFIHLRYAENLLRTHQITYDGIHSNYGDSSLLYVHLLAFFAQFTPSPNLPRAVSSVAHVLLFVGLAWLLIRLVPAHSAVARLLGLVLLYLLVTPSAMRWLDDGMETSLGLCFTAALCWVASRHTEATVASYFALTALAFCAVLLRPELAMLCAIVFVVLLASDSCRLLRSSHVLLGCSLALLFVYVRMHALLPDTALAKSNRSWLEVLSSTVNILASSMSFGLGLLVLWIVTFVLVCRTGRSIAQALIANSVFPLVLLLAAFQGQQVQGARNLVWAYFFSTLWNILELGQSQSASQPNRRVLSLATAFAILLLAVLPFESAAMAHVLRSRAWTLQLMEADRLETLAGQQGVAVDVGYIGYFSRANLCDLAGLINGRTAADLTNRERDAVCAATHPSFLFLRADQLRAFAPHIDITGWQVCTQYDFVNLRTPDLHYLLLPSATASANCKQISPLAKPYPAADLLP